MQAAVEQLSEAQATLNYDVGHILDWSKVYVLTDGVLRFDWFCLPYVIFDGTHTMKIAVKNLSVLIDRILSWGPQLAEVNRKMLASAGSLRLRNFLPISTKITLARSLLLPILDYAA